MSYTKRASDLSLHYVSYGTGKPVILLHGFGANHYSWRHLVMRMPSGYQALSFDLKGFGNSPKPNDKQYSIHDQATLIYRFIVANDLKHVTIIGHSMGGGVALLVAIELLELKKKRLASLVLIGSIAYHQPVPLFISLLQTPIIGPLGVALLPAELQILSILKLAYYDQSKITKKDIDAYAAALETPGSANALVETARQLTFNDARGIAEKYKTIDVPTLILWGRQDQIVPLSVGEKLHKAISKSRMIIIENCGHNPHEECADEAVPLITGFLTDQLK